MQVTRDPDIHAIRQQTDHDGDARLDESVVVLLNVEDQPYHFDLDLLDREVLATSNPGSPQAFPIDGPGWAVLACPAPSH